MNSPFVLADIDGTGFFKITQATDANVEINAASRFSLNEQTVKLVNAADRIIPTPRPTSMSSARRSTTLSGG